MSITNFIEGAKRYIWICWSCGKTCEASEAAICDCGAHAAKDPNTGQYIVTHVDHKKGEVTLGLLVDEA